MYTKYTTIKKLNNSRKLRKPPRQTGSVVAAIKCGDYLLVRKGLDICAGVCYLTGAVNMCSAVL